MSRADPEADLLADYVAAVKADAKTAKRRSEVATFIKRVGDYLARKDILDVDVGARTVEFPPTDSVSGDSLSIGDNWPTIEQLVTVVRDCKETKAALRAAVRALPPDLRGKLPFVG